MSAMKIEYDEKAVEVDVVQDSDDSNYGSKEKYLAETSSVEDYDREFVINHLANSESLKDLLEGDLDYMLEKVKEIDASESMEWILEAIEEHNGDVNFPDVTMDRLKLLAQGQEASGLDPATYDIDIRMQAAVFKYHSPYPEVRAVVSPHDDPEMACETLRAYIIGIIWVGGGSFINEMYHQRQPSITLTATVFQILIYPSGRLLSRILPDKKIGFGKYKMAISPGEWTYKEQMLATIMTNVGSGSTNFFHYGLTMRLPIFFNQTYAGWGFMFLMSLVTNFFGFGLAGVLRRFAVYNPRALWPTVLPILQLNKTLLLPEPKQSINGWTISKYKFFWITFICAFIYFFFPDYIFTALSTFNWMTWISPQNKKLAFITGSKMGLGFNPITTFDWSVINYTTPLVIPFFSVANKYFGVMLAGLVVTGVYFSNYKYTGYFPPNNSAVYDRYGSKYNLSRVITDDNIFDPDLYRSYSQVYIGAGNLTMLGAFYCMYTITFTYIMMGEWRTALSAFKGVAKSFFEKRGSSGYAAFKDPHSRMMSKYPEVPEWWFILVLAAAIGVGAGAICGYPTGTPFWAIIVVILVSIAILIPVIMVFATTGYLVPCDTLTVIIAAYMVPGNATASLLCRVFGYNTDEQAESFISDQKIGHYAKIPPRAVFRSQMIAVLLQCAITTSAVIWLIDNTPDLCTSTQSARLVCSFPNQLYSNTLLLGVVGPHRTYDMLYPLLKWSFLLGGIVGVSFYYLRRIFYRKLKYFHPVVFMSGVTRYGATYNLSYYTPGFYAGLAFMYYIRTRYLLWWTKYNYILSSGLTAGTAFSGILIFFALQYTSTTLKWWGTTVSSAGVDGSGIATLYEAPVDGFGPPVGSWE